MWRFTADAAAWGKFRTWADLRGTDETKVVPGKWSTASHTVIPARWSRWTTHVAFPTARIRSADTIPHPRFVVDAVSCSRWHTGYGRHDVEDYALPFDYVCS